MGNILRRRMELLSERFASTGSKTFAGGTYTSVYVTVDHSTCIIWEGHLVALSVIVETMGTVSFKLPLSSLVPYYVFQRSFINVFIFGINNSLSLEYFGQAIENF